jgi:hypothetical protein
MHREDAAIPPPETAMNPPVITSLPQDRREQSKPQDDAFLPEFDDDALERALKARCWHAKDIGQFLRATTAR